jgi:hypothetical protein
VVFTALHPATLLQLHGRSFGNTQSPSEELCLAKEVLRGFAEACKLHMCHMSLLSL